MSVAGPPRLSPRVAETAGWVVLAALLVTVLPLYLSMPLNFDVGFYDAAGQVALRGGPLESEICFLMPPGMAWSFAAERTLLGGSRLAVRVADLLIVAAVIGLLCRWLRASGLSRAECVWTAVVLSAFYLGTSEWVHAQPDVWMMLPAVGALGLRRGAVEAAAAGARRGVAWSVLEGALLGTACLFKPQMVLAGLAAWLASAALARRAGPGWARRVAPDAFGLLAGGLLVGALWQGSMLATGSWHDYWHDVSLYHREYRRQAPPWQDRVLGPLRRLSPWSWLHLLAIPTALAAVARGAGVSGRSAAAPPARDRAAALLGACYLGWFLEAHFVQSEFSYHVLPAVMLALVLAAGWVSRWPRPARGWAALLGFAAFAMAFDVELSPAGQPAPGSADAPFRVPILRTQRAFAPARLALWGWCWQAEPPAGLQDRLALYSGKPEWGRLAEVAGHLRAQGVTGRDVLCYDTGAVPLYRELNLRPATRFYFPVTLERTFISYRAAIDAELRAGPQRYVVTDLLGDDKLSAEELAAGWPGEPPEVPPAVRARFAGRWPYCEPVVFRAGRYAVHRASGGCAAAATAP